MKIIILSFILLLLSNCSSPHINQKDNTQLNISYEDRVLVAGVGKKIYENKIILSNINIYQSIYKMADQYLIYEYAQASSGYKFTKGIKRSVAIIFDTNDYDLQYTKGNIYFFTLRQKKNEDTIYLIVENSNSSALKLVYGLNKTSYETIKKALQENKVISDTNNTITKQIKKTDMIKTKWSPKVIILDQLVSKPVGRVPFGRK